ncbi:putative nuclease HARBI1 [Mycetomoellerius zeteki]|uniref:putative nuclease HARBI1 n=1 Tax=Mycetomoellerius zeteki TaxID=64791 RepID=UPI00084EA00C|nr:PREDICTED: putative nuclease HARBI1 [Trachymyrmex zeteki]XP_018303608.1 PREDICTED: putative nuclease HARBI1 [Trachymyrmex zeteki]
MNNAGIGFILNFAWDIFFYDTDDEDENVKIPRVYQYAEEIVPRFSDRTFKTHFRITPNTFEELLTKLHSIEDNINVGCKPLPLIKQLMITIWYLSNIESFRSVADRFDISKSTCWDILYRTCKSLLKVNTTYKIISWPNRERAITIMRQFQQINGFPRIIGAIDGSHVHILKPKNHPNSYCNRKNYHSVLLQGVCDSERLFLDVYVGEPGSIHDMRLFKKSDLYARIKNSSIDFPNDSHLVGDLAYQLSPYLLVGFKDVGGLTNREKNFNKKLSQCRVRIENAFAYLKGRFRRLKYLETVRLDLICLLIVSACIMHNISILNGDLPEEFVDNMEIRDIRDYEFIANINEEEGNNAGILKRREIMNILPI